MEQVFVSSVAILLGSLGLLVAIVNADWCFQLPKARWVEVRWGRRGARLAYAALGVVLILLGIYIALRRPPAPRTVAGLGSVLYSFPLCPDS